MTGQSLNCRHQHSHFQCYFQLAIWSPPILKLKEHRVKNKDINANTDLVARLKAAPLVADQRSSPIDARPGKVNISDMAGTLRNDVVASDICMDDAFSMNICETLRSFLRLRRQL